jgi:hypothetical protein
MIALHMLNVPKLYGINHGKNHTKNDARNFK